MEFVDWLSGVLAIASQLLADWPTLVAVVLFTPAVVNLLKWVSTFIPSWNFDGSANLVNFALAAIIFVGLFAVRAFGLDEESINAALVSIATLITAFLSLVGFQLFSSRVSLPLTKKLPGPFGHSYSRD